MNGAVGRCPGSILVGENICRGVRAVSTWSLEKCETISFPRINDNRGNLTFIEGQNHIPFPIERFYYIYDVPGGAERAAHAHVNLHQVYIAMSGSFDVHLDDGRQRRTYSLNRSYFGLYICPMVWRHIDNFSSNSVLGVLASARYDESDYIRDYGQFLERISAE